MTYFGVLLIHYLPCVSTADASIFFGATRRKTRQCNQLQVQWEMASSSIPKHSTKIIFSPLSMNIFTDFFFASWKIFLKKIVKYEKKNIFQCRPSGELNLMDRLRRQAPYKRRERYENILLDATFYLFSISKCFH